MTNKEFAIKLEKRTLLFGVSIINFSSGLGFTPEAKVLRTQITKSGTSIGANYREANRSRSDRDFKNKIKICLGESSETDYWLDILSNLDFVYKEKLSPIHKEAKELLAIFTSIAKKL